MRTAGMTASAFSKLRVHVPSRMRLPDSRHSGCVQVFVAASTQLRRHQWKSQWVAAFRQIFELAEAARSCGSCKTLRENIGSKPRPENRETYCLWLFRKCEFDDELSFKFA